MEPVQTPTRRLAVIGTAGRDRTRPMDAALWTAMLGDLRQRVHGDDILVSGGAAWSDHLAVAAYLEGWVAGLRLYLPAPLLTVPGGHAFQVVARGRCSGSAANYYHGLFRSATGVHGLAQIAQAVREGAVCNEQPARAGFAGMFARNGLVARDATAALAYTWGDQEPTDGGTAHTWRALAHVPRTHVGLQELVDVRLDAHENASPRPR